MTVAKERVLPTSKEEAATLFNENYDNLPEDSDPTGLTPRELGDAILSRITFDEQATTELLIHEMEDGDSRIGKERVQGAVRHLRGVIKLLEHKPMFSSIAADSLQAVERAYMNNGGNPWDLDGDTIDRGRTSHFN